MKLPGGLHPHHYPSEPSILEPVSKNLLRILLKQPAPCGSLHRAAPAWVEDACGPLPGLQATGFLGPCYGGHLRPLHCVLLLGRSCALAIPTDPHITLAWGRPLLEGRL
jgi:hypothetical protein